MIPMHPERGAPPDEVRWVIPDGVFQRRGRVVDVPQALRQLIDGGVIASINVETDAVVIRLHHTEDWRIAGPTIRSALAAALARPADWHFAPGAAIRITPI